MACPNDFHERQETARSAARKQLVKLGQQLSKLSYEYVNIIVCFFLSCAF